MTNYTERKLIQLNASVVEPNGIAIIYMEVGTIGKQRWASKPTGTLVYDNGDYHEVDFTNAFIAQQLPNASIHILSLKRSTTNAR